MSATDTVAGSSAPSPVPMLNLSSGVPFPAGTSVSQAVAANSAAGSGPSALSNVASKAAAFLSANTLTVLVGLILAIIALVGSTRGTKIDVSKLAQKVAP